MQCGLGSEVWGLPCDISCGAAFQLDSTLFNSYALEAAASQDGLVAILGKRAPYGARTPILTHSFCGLACFKVLRISTCISHYEFIFVH